MRMKTRLVLAIALLTAAAPLLSACYTTRGAGEDLKAAGQGISNSADRNTNYKP
jgi:predicted small secreted protein